MHNTFSPSVNIIRDSNVTLNYIATPNALEAYSRILGDVALGTRAFNLIGAYGVGKSAFLKAFEEHLSGKFLHFDKYISTTQLSVSQFDFIKVVGEYSSIQEVFANQLGLADASANDILRAFDNVYSQSSNSNKGLVILIDEFGKFLEFAASNNPESELYFIQELAEYVNDKRKNIILISTLHQDFNQYAFELNRRQQNEWDKVKGRLKEIAFNEPVEQLLYLASIRLEQYNFNCPKHNLRELFTAVKVSSLFPLKDYMSIEFAEKLLPIDILAASILTLSLQKYGQNERSLFSFLESGDPFSLESHDMNFIYNVSNVYDYLIHNFNSVLNSKFNPHFAAWASVRSSIERIESVYEGDIRGAVKIIKTIGLLNVFGSAGGKIDRQFIEVYGNIALGISNTVQIIQDLIRLKVVNYVNFQNRFKLTQGTDLDIEKAIAEAGSEIRKPSNVTTYLQEYFSFGSVLAKATYFATGVPRLFEYQIVDTPVVVKPEGEIDGYIQLVFGDVKQADLRTISADCEEPIIFVLYKDVSAIQNVLYEIIKIQKVRGDNGEDKVAQNELSEMLAYNFGTLNRLVLEEIFVPDKANWFIGGNKETILNAKQLNRRLSILAENIYSHTPIYRNEMVNRTKLSTPIITARKMLMRHLVSNWESLTLGYLENAYPPDKTIFLSLLSHTGIHREEDGAYDLSSPLDPSFQPLWNLGEEYLVSARNARRNLQDLIDLMLQKPFGLKKGFVDFWVPIFLFAKRNDFALFQDGIYIPDLTDETLELIARKPSDYEIKAFNVDGVKLKLFKRYRDLLQQSATEEMSNRSFIETIKPFLKFYAKEINDYSRQTERISMQSVRLRSAIAKSKDPEKAFFEDFPAALGYTLEQLRNDNSKLENYINDLRVSVIEIRSSYSHLVDRFEEYIAVSILGRKLQFEEYKSEMQLRFEKIKKHFLKPEQKAFVQRVNSPLDDKVAWLNALVQVCMGKTLERFTDEDEIKLYSVFSDMIRELDNLTELSAKDYDEENEDVIKVAITSFVDGIKENLVRLPKSKSKIVQEKETQILKLMGSDTNVNIAVLTNLLQNELKK